MKRYRSTGRHRVPISRRPTANWPSNTTRIKTGRRAAAEEFKEAAEAYEVLQDDQKRAQYDRFGHDGLRGDRAAAPGSAG